MERIAFVYFLVVSLSCAVPVSAGTGRCDTLPGECSLAIPVKALQYHKEWLVKFEINGQPIYSGPSPYSDLTDRIIEVVANEPCNISIGVGFSTYTYDEYIKIWLDTDNNGYLDADKELLWATQIPAPAYGTGLVYSDTTLILPGNLLKVPMRLRVAMQRNAWPQACDDVLQGEIEDYSVLVTAPFSEPEPSVVVRPNPAANEVHISWNNFTVFPDELYVIEGGGHIFAQAHVAGRNSHHLHVEGLADGLYYIVLKNSNQTLQITPLHIRK